MNLSTISTAGTGSSKSPRTTLVTPPSARPSRSATSTRAVGASARRGDISGSTRTSTRAARARMRGSPSAGSAKAETSARPSTSAAATAYGMENLAPSIEAGAVPAIRGPNGIVVTTTRSTSSARTSPARASASRASSAKWL